MKRAAVEDDDARELLLRVADLQQANRGYLRSRFTEVGEEGFDTAERRASTRLIAMPTHWIVYGKIDPGAGQQ